MALLVAAMLAAVLPIISASRAHASTPAYDVQLVSSPPDGLSSSSLSVDANNDAFISADGRFVAYDASSQAMVTDRATGHTTVVSHANGDPAAWATSPCRITGMSADGRYVAFTSQAQNLTADGSYPSSPMPYVADTVSGVVTPVPVPAAASDSPMMGNISADGRYVLIAESQWGQVPHLFVVDRSTGDAREVAGLTSSEMLGSNLAISGDAGTVAFVEWNTTARANELRVYDLSSGSFIYSNTDARGELTMSDDGHVIAWDSHDWTTVKVARPYEGRGFDVHQDYGASGPALSRDGNTLFYSGEQPDTYYNFYSVNITGRYDNAWGLGTLVAADSSGSPIRSYGINGAGATKQGTGVAFVTSGLRSDCCTLKWDVAYASIPDSSAPGWDSAAKLIASNVTGSSLTLNWPAASDDTGVTGYSVTEDGHFVADVLSARSYQVDGLEPGSHHTFTVEARDIGNHMTDLPSLDITTPSGNQAGSAPLSAIAAPGGIATLQWDADPAAEAYRVLRATGDGAFQTVADNVTATTWKDSGLLASTHYRYTVEAVSSGTATPYTTQASIDTPAITLTDVQVLPDKVDGGAINASGHVNVKVDGEANRTATAVLHWANAPDVTVQLPENTPGGYAAATTVPAGATALTGVTATLSDGVDSHAVSADATGLPLPVSGTIEVTVLAPKAGDIAGSTLAANSGSLRAGAHTTVTGPGTYDLAVSPAPDYGVSLTLPDGRTIASTGGVAVSANATSTATLQPVWPDASLKLHVQPPAGEQAGGVTVSVTNDYNYSKTLDLAPGVTDATFDGLSTGGSYRVLVELDDLKRPITQQLTTTVVVGEGSNDLVVQETALPKATLAGVVTGGAVPRAGVKLGFSEYVDGRSWTYSTTTGNDGSYRVDLLAGSVTVSPQQVPFGYTTKADVVDAAPGVTTTHDIQLGTFAGSHVVHLRLYTQDFGGQESLQTLDWTTNIHFHTTLTDSDGTQLGINGNDTLVPSTATSLTFCADGREAGLPRGCTTVSLNSYEVTLELHLAQAGGVTASLLAPSGSPSSGRWRVSATPVDANGLAVGSPVMTSGDGPAVRFGVPAAGSYRVEFTGGDGSSYLTTVDVPDLGEVDLGTVQLVSRTPFYAAGTSVVADPVSVLPGQLTEVRVQFTAATTMTGAVLRLGVAFGATLVPDGVTLNGQPVSGNLVDGFFEVPLGDLVAGDSGVVRYSLQVADDAAAGPLSAQVRVRYNGTLDDPVGVGTATVVGVELDAPYDTAQPSVAIRGRAPAGSVVQVLDGGHVVGTASAGPGGLWSATVDLGSAPAGVPQQLVATTVYLGGTLTSNVAGVVYDPSWVAPTSITVSQPSGRAHTFDPSQGTAYFTLVYVPSEPVRVSATFPDTSRLLQPTAWVGTSSAAMTCDATTCTADVPVTASTVGDVRVDYDLAPVVPASVQDLPPAPTADQASADLAGPFAGTASTVTPAADGSSVAVHGSGVASDGASPMDVDSTVTVSRTATQPVGEAVTIAQGVTMYVTHALSVDGEGNATFTEDLAVPAGYASQLAASSQALQPALARLAPADTLSDWIVFHVATAITGTKGAIGALLNTWQHIRVAPDKYYDRLTDILAEIDNASCLSSTQKALLKAEVDTAGVQTTLIYTMQGFTPWVLVLTAPEIDGALGLSGIGAGLARGALSSAFSWTFGRWMQQVVGDTKADVDKVMADSGCQQVLPPPGPPAAHPTIIFDPSGFTYEALASNRLAGVTATIEAAPSADGPWTTWDAAAFGQDNPQVTDAQGRFGWEVPVGWYRVRFDKPGYFTTYSQVVHVLPEWTDLDVGLGRVAPAAVTGVAIDPDKITVSFDTWMKVDSVVAQTSVVGPGRSPVPGKLVPLDPQTAPDGTVLATSFAYETDHGYHGNAVTITVARAALDYAGVALGSDVTKTFPLHGGQP